MNFEDGTQILSLAFDPPIPLMNSNPLRIYYAVSSELDAPGTFDSSNPVWTLRKSGGERNKTNALLNQLQDAHVGGTRLIEFAWCENTSMWQFLPAYVWLQFFLAVELIDVVKSIIENTKPRKLHFFPTGDPTSPIWRGVIQEIARVSGLPVHVVHETTTRGLRVAARNFLRNVGAGKLVRVFHNRNNVTQESLPKATVGISRRIVFLTLGKRHWVPVPGVQTRMHDEQMYPLLPAIRSAGWNDFVMVDCLDLPSEELEKRMRNGEPGVRWRAYSSYRERGNSIYSGARRVFATLWRSLEQDEEFFEDFMYQDIHLMPVLRTVLQRAFLELLPECAQMLNTASRMIRQERPCAVVATYETGPWERAVIIQAARAGIPTIGLQHGMIFDGDPDNLHLRVTSDPNTPGFMIPHITCVWGPFWKDVLTKSGHYTSESVVVTGNWRYDRLSEIRRIDINEAKRRHSIDPAKKVVLFLSVGLGTVEYLRTCLQTIAKREELTPLIKLHPGVDKPGPVIEMLRELGHSEEILVKGQLIDALLVSDVVVSQYSTAIGEAGMLDKPIIMVNFQGFLGGEDYIQSGICLYVTRSQDLLSAIEEALYDKSARSQMSISREGFVARYFYKLDGRAAERVADALKALSETHNSSSLTVPPAHR